MSPRKPSSQELTKEMIKNEARTQFVEKDFHQVSMRSIAKQLGCSHGALYYHFNNKAELFYAIIEEYFLTLNKLIEEIVNDSGDNHTKLKNVFLRFIEFGLNHQSQYEIMFMIRNTEVDALSQEAANLSYQHFARSVQSLSMNKLLISDIYSAFIALHGFVSHYRGYFNSFEEAKDAAYLHVDFLVKSLTNLERSKSV
ncbi:TetR/AcrR family transcriptional regulator [Metabacillus arenae]|uniref:TetR/AcrR family transcriptional regulator n=1 Tax=Metabacillus arenae TaxID=2771434 RepID=A0A926RYV4_9BACI|nr:TetR/AcrR family transcriptional regulator [Metabacillus arenae]MBD1382471.1 TetR/AcrR family transcriptional regulator [Metabacillus arenae]